MTEREILVKILNLEIAIPNDAEPSAELAADFLLSHDVVPVVKCRDCVHFGQDHAGECSLDDFSRDADRDYCSYAARKEALQE